MSTEIQHGIQNRRGVPEKPQLALKASNGKARQVESASGSKYSKTLRTHLMIQAKLQALSGCASSLVVFHPPSVVPGAEPSRCVTKFGGSVVHAQGCPILLMPG